MEGLANAVVVTSPRCRLAQTTNIERVPDFISEALAGNPVLTPELMAIGASCFGVMAMIMGLCCSWFYDTPTGPSVVVCSALFFTVIQLIPNENGYFTPQ